MLYCVSGYLMDLGFRDVPGAQAAHRRTFIVDFEHDLHGLFHTHRKKHLQHFNDEFHRGEIVIQ